MRMLLNYQVVFGSASDLEVHYVFENSDSVINLEDSTKYISSEL